MPFEVPSPSHGRLCLDLVFFPGQIQMQTAHRFPPGVWRSIGGGGYGRDRMGSRRGEQSGGGAEHLARIHGTEEDRVNARFTLRSVPADTATAAPAAQQARVQSDYLVIAQNGDPASLDQRQVDEDFEDFYEEVFEELCKFGKLEELNICDNLGDHLYEDEEHAAAAQKSLYGRFYAGRPLVCEFSPVTDFREARCRQFDEGTCNRGGYCNFMHIKTVSRSMQRELERMFNRGRPPAEAGAEAAARVAGASGMVVVTPVTQWIARCSEGRILRRKGSRSRSPSPAKKDRRSRSRSHSPRSPARGSKRDTPRTEGGVVEKKD
ncbi:Nucleotide-binding alpha-beta plait domain [Phytophthora cactorum]|nr:Nucleotide-binding alpha-beta plait domain [Phytophthora cactorum]